MPGSHDLGEECSRSLPCQQSAPEEWWRGTVKESRQRHQVVEATSSRSLSSVGMFHWLLRDGSPGN